MVTLCEQLQKFMHNTLNMETTTFSGEIKRKQKIFLDMGVSLIEIEANLQLDYLHTQKISIVTTAKPEPSKHLKAGEINFDYIPRDWALTPLKGKRAYIAGWTTQPYSIDQIKSEFEQGKATGIGLITGQWSNEGGLVWVDIDGPAAIKDLEELAGCLLYTSPSPRDS